MDFGKKIVMWATVATATCLFVNAQAEELIYSGFMSDYTQLEKVADGSARYRYVAPGSEDRLIKYNAVMIDEPEIFIANDSPYRGVKPKQLAAFAESLRTGLASAMSDRMYVVNRPGENVLYVTVAASNLKLNKKKKSVLGYTPIGLVSGAVRGAATTDLAKKADLQGLVFELEAFDSVSGQRVVAIIDSIGTDAESPANWEELEAFMAKYGRLIQCRFDNARLREEQRVNCLAQD
jgi:hypothetical protein